MDGAEVVHQAIWERMPELRDGLLQYERESVEFDLEHGNEPFIGPYALITDVLVQPHLLPLLDVPGGEVGSLARCAEAVEQILQAHSKSLNDAVGTRIVSHLLRKPERWQRFREHAGPLLKDYVREASQYYVWPYEEPVV